MPIFLADDQTIAEIYFDTLPADAPDHFLFGNDADLAFLKWVKNFMEECLTTKPVVPPPTASHELLKAFHFEKQKRRLRIM
jgi:hypothetical protein